MWVLHGERLKVPKCLVHDLQPIDEVALDGGPLGPHLSDFAIWNEHLFPEVVLLDHRIFELLVIPTINGGNGAATPVEPFLALLLSHDGSGVALHEGADAPRELRGPVSASCGNGDDPGQGHGRTHGAGGEGGGGVPQVLTAKGRSWDVCLGRIDCRSSPAGGTNGHKRCPAQQHGTRGEAAQAEKDGGGGFAGHACSVSARRKAANSNSARRETDKGLPA
mmetsp:Transcript_69744/g.181493  ORF Transcript_69744/g.181493 Transcript_69744/m.181493 type:complete len:221 (-) Transcript_69744:3-665(-)